MVPEVRIKVTLSWSFNWEIDENETTNIKSHGYCFNSQLPGNKIYKLNFKNRL